jgi:hypothetical protein
MSLSCSSWDLPGVPYTIVDAAQCAPPLATRVGCLPYTTYGPHSGSLPHVPRQIQSRPRTLRHASVTQTRAPSQTHWPASTPRACRWHAHIRQGRTSTVDAPRSVALERACGAGEKGAALVNEPSRENERCTRGFAGDSAPARSPSENVADARLLHARAVHTAPTRTRSAFLTPHGMRPGIRQDAGVLSVGGGGSIRGRMVLPAGRGLVGGDASALHRCESQNNRGKPV